jgi:hypothetical protein
VEINNIEITDEVYGGIEPQWYEHCASMHSLPQVGDGDEFATSDKG